MAKLTLDQWIKECLGDPDKDGRITSMTLVHMVERIEKEIHTVKFGAKQWEPKDLAALFRGKAETHAAETVGVQMYNLLAFWDNRSEPQARKPLMIQGESDYGGMATEPPTKEGQTMQGMRHMEAVIQLAFRQTALLFESSNTTVKALVQQNESLMRENRECFDIFKQMVLEKVTGDHTRRMDELAYQRGTTERAKWMGLAPALVNTVFGKEIFPQASADTALLDSVMDGIDEQGIQQLAAIIKPEVFAPLAQRMGQRMRERRLKAEQEQALMNGADDTRGSEH